MLRATSTYEPRGFDEPPSQRETRVQPKAEQQPPQGEEAQQQHEAQEEEQQQPEQHQRDVETEQPQQKPQQKPQQQQQQLQHGQPGAAPHDDGAVKAEGGGGVARLPADAQSRSPAPDWTSKQVCRGAWAHVTID